MTRFAFAFLLLITACTQQGTTTSAAPTAADDGKADGASCSSTHVASDLFDIWAEAQSVGQQAYRTTYRLEAVADTSPPTFAVVQTDRYNQGWHEFHYLVTLDDQGNELARASGRYIDRISQGKYLLDLAYEEVVYGASNDPLFYENVRIYASDHDGNVLWSLSAEGNAEKSKIFRMDGTHWLLVGQFNSSMDAKLTYFDGNGDVSDAPEGDQRACATQPAHSVCLGQCD